MILLKRLMYRVCSRIRIYVWWWRLMMMDYHHQNSIEYTGEPEVLYWEKLTVVVRIHWWEKVKNSLWVRVQSLQKSILSSLQWMVFTSKSDRICPERVIYMKRVCLRRYRRGVTKIPTVWWVYLHSPNRQIWKKIVSLSKYYLEEKKRLWMYCDHYGPITQLLVHLISRTVSVYSISACWIVEVCDGAVTGCELLMGGMGCRALVVLSSFPAVPHHNRSVEA